ncbi:hypothetical protein B0H13DRAFT_2281459 [Mycena leptocephala]|nr:hypothetical protein B0H13DRAFT_2281459 [Mycena leptocephala]
MCLIFLALLLPLRFDCALTMRGITYFTCFSPENDRKHFPDPTFQQLEAGKFPRLEHIRTERERAQVRGSQMTALIAITGPVKQDFSVQINTPITDFDVSTILLVEKRPDRGNVAEEQAKRITLVVLVVHEQELRLRHATVSLSLSYPDSI